MSTRRTDARFRSQVRAQMERMGFETPLEPPETTGVLTHCDGRHLRFSRQPGNKTHVRVDESGNLQVRLLQRVAYPQLIIFQSQGDFRFTDFEVRATDVSPESAKTFIHRLLPEDASHDQCWLLIRYFDETSLGEFHYTIKGQLDGQFIEYDPQIVNQGGDGLTPRRARDI